jgi:hypothetical protein
VGWVWGHKGGRGPQTDKTPAAKSLYRSIFTTFGIAFYQSNLRFFHLKVDGEEPGLAGAGGGGGGGEAGLLSTHQHHAQGMQQLHHNDILSLMSSLLISQNFKYLYRNLKCTTS